MWIKRHTIYAIESVYMQTGVHTIKPSHSPVLLHIVSLNAYVTPHFHHTTSERIVNLSCSLLLPPIRMGKSAIGTYKQ
jgi:hypothetical protein